MVYKLNHPITYNYVIIQVEKNNIWINFMNYKKIYFQIIRNRRNNPLAKKSYGEVHHIKPCSFGGLDTPENLIRLSAREHFIVHFLLYKMYKYRSQVLFPYSKREKERYKKMTFAFSMMINSKSKSYKRLDKNINNCLYEELRKSVSEMKTVYSYEYTKLLFDFYIKNNITQKTMVFLNKKFNTSFNYKQLLKLFYRNNLKISDYKDCPFAKRYGKNKIKKIFDFYIQNNISSKTIDAVNIQFNTNFTYSTLTKLFNDNNLKISDHKDCPLLKRYDKNKVQEMFNFYIQNNILPKTMGILNKQFNTSLTYKQLYRLFNDNNLKISNHRDRSILKRKCNYDKNKVQEMFDFYIKNNITKKKMDIFNKQFNTSFTIKNLRGLFYRNNLKISNYREAVV